MFFNFSLLGHVEEPGQPWWGVVTAHWIKLESRKCYSFSTFPRYVQTEIAYLVKDNFLFLHQKSQVLEENHLFLKTADNFLTEGQNEVI